MSPPAATTWLYGAAGGLPGSIILRVGVCMPNSLYEAATFASCGAFGKLRA